MVIRLHKKVFLLLLTVIWLTCLILFLYWQDNGLTVTRSEYRSPSVPRGFDGFTVVQLSDLHNKQFGKEQKALLDTLAALSPDAIFLTGDLIDRRRYDLDTAIKLVEGAVKLAPVYYVSGNHEVLSGHYDEILERLQAAGVHTLENEETSLTAGGASLPLCGLSDPQYFSTTLTGRLPDQQVALLDVWSQEYDFLLLLCHRPEVFDEYAVRDIGLVFTGHAHGGQFRLPLIGGLFAPGQGLFPAYTSGSYTEGAATMYVSRGLGNSLMPIRLFNRPEVVAVTLRSEGPL